MAIQKIQPSYKFNEEQLKQLRQIAPEAFKDNILDFNALYEALSDSLEEDDLETEHFGLSWPGKAAAKKMTGVASRGTLIPLPNEGVDEAKTRNIFIEGENLEVLKIIQKAYAGRVKMVVIDPPYNTGSDLIYDDDFKESLEEYFKRTGQIDEKGKKVTTNTKADGRFHSKWLSMMYPRLKTAKNILQEEGIILVCIDDNEVGNLRLLMDEIFGGENFIATFLWKKKSTSTNVEGVQVSSLCDYILAYGKTDASAIKQRVRSKETRTYPFSDSLGAYRTSIIEKKDSGSYRRDTMKFEILGQKPRSGKRWQIGEKTARDLEAKNRFLIDDGVVKLKIYDFDDKDTFSAQPNLLDNHGTTDVASKLVNNELFNIPELFSNPKPLELLNHLIDLVVDDGDIVCDFFAGSGSTGHSVFLKNASGALVHDIQFLLVQMQELTAPNSEAFKNGYTNIAQITKERLRRASKKVLTETKNKKCDLGFKCYSLSYSNFKVWKNYTGTDTKQLETLFSQHESSLVDDWKPENLLTEILLIEGFPLDSKIESVETFKKNNVQKVTSDFCEHALFVCLDKKVEDETIKTLSLGDNDIFICLDNAATDQDKARLDDKGLITTI